MKRKLKLAIVGATGLVGSTILQVLEEKNLPIDNYTFFATAKSKGKEILFKGKKYLVQELTEKSFDKHFDFAIFSAGSNTAKRYAPIAAQNNCIVIDNSSCFRMDKDIPLIVPEVNSRELEKHKNIIANPNCSTIQSVIPLKPLDDKYTIKRIVYSTYQAVSGAGKKGIDDLINTTDGKAPSKFAHPIYNNCLPHIDNFLDNGYTKEEMKMIFETRKILGKPNLPITATTVRVPVLNSHSISINVEFKKKINYNDVVDLLKNFPSIVIQNDFPNNVYPMATKSSGKDEVFVGRIRIDESVKSGINLWVVADNLRKGAATNAVQILEALI